MKDLFPAYYSISEEQASDLFESAIIVLDTNALLQFYRYSEPTREQFFGILDQFKDQLWLPHQVAYEYQRNRPRYIFDQHQAYEGASDALDDSLKALKSGIVKFKQKFQTHSVVDVDKLFSQFEKFIEKQKKELNKQQKAHPNWLHNDPIRTKFDHLYMSKVGQPYLPERLKEIYEEGKTRFEADPQQPPGYVDYKNKSDERAKCGDLIIWFQIIDQAIAEKKPIIFVTRDEKEDWWWEVDGHTIGCRIELTEEMIEKARVNYYQYKPERFFKYAQEQLNLKSAALDKALMEERDLTDQDRKRQLVIQAWNNQHNQILQDRAIQRIAQFKEEYDAAMSATAAFRENVERERERMAQFRTEYDRVMSASPLLSERLRKELDLQMVESRRARQLLEELNLLRSHDVGPLFDRQQVFDELEQARKNRAEWEAMKDAMNDDSETEEE